MRDVERRRITAAVKRVDCSIAGGVVTAILRRGTTANEPDGVYVRCDQRDCQYADVNATPCPLRVEMFRAPSDDVIRAYLASRAGRGVCYSCLGTVAGVSHDATRRGLWHLLADHQPLRVGPGRCRRCGRRCMTIALRSIDDDTSSA
jgi:hypothetical protein